MNYLYSRIIEIVGLYGTIKPATLNKMAHETLAMACHEGLKGTGQAYGNLFSQVDFLCRKHNVRLADRVQIQTMRRNTNRRELTGRDDFMYDMRALGRFVSAVTSCGMPGELLRLLPANDRPHSKAEGLDVLYVRCIVRDVDGNYIYVSAEKGLPGQLLAVDISADELVYLRKMVHEGVQLNLLDCKLGDAAAGTEPAARGAEHVIEPGLVVFEPDYLIDISSLAACFKDYGHHPLTYTLERMRPKADSQAILLGNLAGAVLDGIVNDGDTFSLSGTMRTNFAEKALEFCACTEFNAAQFKQDIKTQADNIREAVGVMFTDHDRALAVLEPSFVCERLGLQGRVDLMTTDFRLLVEQKSGRNRNIENGRPGNHGSYQLEPHYVQSLLYYGVLRYNFHLGFNSTDIRLLYSKYPAEKGLMAMSFYRGLFREALELRNKIVATDFIIARKGFGRILPLLTPETVNAAKRDDMYYHTWLLPRIEKITGPLKSLNPLEREYFCRMATFACREQLIGKVGSQEGVTGCTADLWNMPIAEKIETGNIYTGLKITAKECGGDGGEPDRLTLSVPGQGEGFLPNFRRGDMVYLYSYRDGQEPDVRNSLLYRANITEVHTEEIKVALRNGQKNPAILAVQEDGDGLSYAIEHAGGDTVADAALRSLYEFVTAPADRKALLLAQRAPRRDAGARLTRTYSKAYDDILLAAKQAEDY